MRVRVAQAFQALFLSLRITVVPLDKSEGPVKDWKNLWGGVTLDLSGPKFRIWRTWPCPPMDYSL